jgi:6-pyruvoyltetrahydropterin/6-carboxytetrahydropterin synthase
MRSNPCEWHLIVNHGPLEIKKIRFEISMYTVAVKRDLIAQHYLIQSGQGEENRNHSHHYQVELQVKGRELNQYGYLLDIVDIEYYLDEQVRYYKDKTLNDLPEFMGLNPSIECFAYILSNTLANRINATTAIVIEVKIWENDNTWASHRYVKQDAV